MNKILFSLKKSISDPKTTTKIHTQKEEEWKIFDDFYFDDDEEDNQQIFTSRLEFLSSLDFLFSHCVKICHNKSNNAL